jgi:hypothetical protein
VVFKQRICADSGGLHLNLDSLMGLRAAFSLGRQPLVDQIVQA